MSPEENDKMDAGKATGSREAPKSTSRNDLEDLFPFVKDDGATQNSSQENAAMDPQEVFNASLEFQHTFKPSPPRRSIEYRGSSSSRRSLYPSIASLGDSDEVVDVERNWEAASRQSMRKRASAKDGPLIDESELKVEAAASLPTSPVASMPGASATGTVRIPSERNEKDENDLIARKLAAYSCGSVTSARSRASANDEYDDDDDMIAMKRAAYGGYSASSTQVQAFEQHTQETVAEHDVASEAAATVAFNGATGATAEATVIESGPMEKATPEAWSAAPAAEATVLHDDGIHQQDVTDLDCKPPARDSRQEQQPSGGVGHGDALASEEAEATIIGFDAHPTELSMEAVQAEYVGQDYSAAAVDVAAGGEVVPAQASEVTGSSNTGTYQINGQEVEEEQVTEVDVIESGPMEKATAEAWSATTSGEARVLAETGESHASAFASKTPSEASNECWQSEVHSESDTFSMMHGEAEVVGITEEVHPSELDNTASAQAELVCSDFNTAIAIPSSDQGQNGMNHDSCGVEAAEIIVESCDDGNDYHRAAPATPQAQRQPQEAHATLVGERESSEYDQRGTDATPVSAVLSPYADDGRSTSDPFPATPVTVLEDSPAVQSGVSFSDNVKQEPYSGRTASAPSPQCDVLPELSTLSRRYNVDSNDEEPEWTRVPSFGGDGDSAPAPIPPPVATSSGFVETAVSPPPIPSPHPVGQEPNTSARNRMKSNASSASDASVPGFQMVRMKFAVASPRYYCVLTLFSRRSAVL